MTHNATGSLNCARAALPALAAAALLLSALPAHAQEDVTDERVTVGDVMLTPLTDLNISKDPIPPVLIRAYAAPYDDVGLTDCSYILQEIGNLDAVLGEDFDTAAREQPSGSTEKIAQSVLASFIPFRGVIRHFSGANRHALEFHEAITAGLSRRAFLKGLGQGMGCAYPARPAPPGLMVHPESDEGSHGMSDAPASQSAPSPASAQGH